VSASFREFMPSIETEAKDREKKEITKKRRERKGTRNHPLGRGKSNAELPANPQSFDVLVTNRMPHTTPDLCACYSVE
jgi:hypothetical protein